jgi:hypothetical protein
MTVMVNGLRSLSPRPAAAYAVSSSAAGCRSRGIIPRRIRLVGSTDRWHRIHEPGARASLVLVRAWCSCRCLGAGTSVDRQRLARTMTGNIPSPVGQNAQMRPRRLPTAGSMPRTFPLSPHHERAGPLLPSRSACRRRSPSRVRGTGHFPHGTPRHYPLTATCPSSMMRVVASGISFAVRTGPLPRFHRHVHCRSRGQHLPFCHGGHHVAGGLTAPATGGIVVATRCDFVDPRIWMIPQPDL